MAGIKGKFSAKDLKKLQEHMDKITQQGMDTFVATCTKAIAAELLRRVKDLTPVGDYPKETGKKGGTLRRSWTIRIIGKEGGAFKVNIVNPMDYASYVEYGHRQTPGRYVPALGKRLKQAWVPGKMMLTISESRVEKLTPQFLEAKVEKFLRECMG